MPTKLNRLYSRDGSTFTDLMPLGTSFNLIDTFPGGSPANVQSLLAWHGAAIGTNQFTILAWLCHQEVAGLLFDANDLGYKNTDIYFTAPFTKNGVLVDGYGLPTAQFINNNLAAIATNNILNYTSINNTWNMVGIQQNGANLTQILNGRTLTQVLGAPPNAGITKFSTPGYVLSGASANNDWYAGGNSWSANRFALLVIWSRVLSQQEILDFYGATKFGMGYAISRVGLSNLTYGRRDSTTAGDIATLPAYAAFDTARTTIPDLSGSANAMNLYTDKAAWSDVLGGTNTNPGIFVPKFWYDSNAVYNKRSLLITGNGATLST